MSVHIHTLRNAFAEPVLDTIDPEHFLRAYGEEKRRMQSAAVLVAMVNLPELERLRQRAAGRTRDRLALDIEAGRRCRQDLMRECEA